MAEQVKLKLHLGCGKHIFKGWVNIDYKNIPGVDLVWDLLRCVPFENDSVDFIFTSHLLEHFTLQEGQSLLDECHRVLKYCGCMRIVVPSIEKAIQLYQSGWQKEHWIKKNGITSAAQFVNAYFKFWGHQYIYDKNELFNALDQGGFRFISTRDYRQSGYPELCNLENHNDLILEATK